MNLSLSFFFLMSALSGHASTRSVYFATGAHPNHLKLVQAHRDYLDGTFAYELPDGNPTNINGWIDFAITNVGKNGQNITLHLYRYDGVELTGWDSTYCTMVSGKCTCNLNTRFKTCRPTMTYHNNNEIPYWGKIDISTEQGGVVAMGRIASTWGWSCADPVGKAVDNKLPLYFPILINGGLPF